MVVSIIAAVADNGIIGRAGSLVYRIPADLARLKRLTMGHYLVMGRRTYESIGGPLPGRTTIVISRDPDYKAPGCLVRSTLEAAFEEARGAGENELFVLGGGEIYRMALPIADRLYLTRVHATPPGDTSFPPIGPEWIEVRREEHPEGEPVGYSFVEYRRRPLPA